MPQVLILLFCLIALPSNAFGWGREGHQTIALIAEAQLNPSARAHVKTLLNLEGYSSLSEIASWADEIRGTELDKVSHAVRIPFDSDDFLPDRDCAKKTKCVIFGIQNSKLILADTTSSPQEKLIALKFLVHFVGDIHQPLHAISETGKMNVVMGTHTYTLHKVWDTIAIRSYHLSPDLLAKSLLLKKPDIHQESEVDWALESHSIAKQFIYHNDKARADDRSPMPIAENYLNSIRPVIYQQLSTAGVRLGNLINMLLGS